MSIINFASKHNNVGMLYNNGKAPQATCLYMPVSRILPLVKLLGTKGINIQSAMDGTGIELHDLTKSNACIEFESYLQLITNARRLCHNEPIGLRLGELLFLNDSSSLMRRMMASREVKQACELLVKYQTLFSQVLKLEFKVYESFARLSVEPVVNLGNALPFFIEYSFSVIYCLTKFCLGIEHFRADLQFSYPDMKLRADYESFFGNDVMFGGKRNCIEIPLEGLLAPSIFFHHSAALVSEQGCMEGIEKIHAEPALLQSVKSYFRNTPLHQVSQIDLASKLHTSPSGLKRRLSVYGTSFSEIFENERKILALVKLKQASLNLEAVSEVLGYQNASSFSRAFKRWYGVSPAHYLKQEEPVLKRQSYSPNLL